MKPEWEDVASGTERLNVFGGWIVLYERCAHPNGRVCDTVFVPDPNHEWVLDKE